jgi:threonine dehydrogenase-like Zn-dependent dehydrogenase
MRAVRARDRVIEVVDVPRPAGDGVRVRVRSAGICGSDLHIVASPFNSGKTLGHEIAGVAPDGTAVAIEPLLACGACARCVEGDYNCCERGPGTLIGVGHDGGMAEEIVVPERCLVSLPAGIRVEDACLVEPLAVVVHGLRRAQLRGGERVAVIGGGTIGLCAVAAARDAGARVDLAARHDAQREAGARLGAGEPSGTYDLVIDAAGTRSALEQALALCRARARLLLVASYWGGLELPGFALCLKEVDVFPASMYGRSGASRDIDAAAALLARQSGLASLLITHRFPLDAAGEAFATAADRAAGAIKVVLEPGA